MKAPHDAAVAPSRLFGVPASTMALLLLFLATLDSLATILVLRRQLGFELNPLMRWLHHQGEAQFLLIKLLLTALCMLWMMRRAWHPYARIVALVGFSIYLPIVGLHIFNNFARALVP